MDDPPTDLGARVGKLFPDGVALAVATEASFEAPLLPGEARTVLNAVASRRRDFTAGRDCARNALLQLHAPPQPILVGKDRAPIWPPGFVGSISHCKGFCAAVAARQTNLGSIGFDAENLSALSAGAARVILTPAEAETLSIDPPTPGLPWVTIAFSAKEAVYKCLYPILGVRLSFHDVEIAFSADGSFAVKATGGDLSQARLIQTIEGRWNVDDLRVYTGATLGAGLQDGLSAT